MPQQSQAFTPCDRRCWLSKWARSTWCLVLVALCGELHVELLCGRVSVYCQNMPKWQFLMGNVMTAGFWVLFLYISYLSDLKLAWLLPRSRRTTNAAVLCFRVFSPLFVLIETPHFFQLKLVCFHMCLFKKKHMLFMLFIFSDKRETHIPLQLGSPRPALVFGTLVRYAVPWSWCCPWIRWGITGVITWCNLFTLIH